MGITHVDAIVTGFSGASRDIQLLVDSGATCSVLPDHVRRRELAIEPKRTVYFRLADGSSLGRQAGECHFRLATADGTPRVNPLLAGLSTAGPSRR
jgi:hypothetical protein